MMRTLIVILMLVVPVYLQACPMCQGGEGFSGDSIFAYKLTTAFLASLPILMGAGIYWWIRRHLANISRKQG